tara:strand:+ start:8471 stop:9373 length:903 start_codon:yes stop_codon:yes gene_type:complete
MHHTDFRVFARSQSLGDESTVARAQRQHPLRPLARPSLELQMPRIASTEYSKRRVRERDAVVEQTQRLGGAARRKIHPERGVRAERARLLSKPPARPRELGVRAVNGEREPFRSRHARAAHDRRRRGDARVIIIDSVIIDIIVVDRSRARDEHVRDGREPADERLRQDSVPREGFGVVLERDEDDSWTTHSDGVRRRRARAFDRRLGAREETSRAREGASFDRARASRTLEDDGADDARDEEEVEENARKRQNMLELEYEVRRRIARARDAIDARDALKTRARARRRLTPDAGIREHVVE